MDKDYEMRYYIHLHYINKKIIGVNMLMIIKMLYFKRI